MPKWLSWSGALRLDCKGGTGAFEFETTMAHHPVFYAHSSGASETSDWHLLAEHLQEVGRRAADFLATIGAAEPAYVAGALHDLGKYSHRFQDRLHGDPRSIDHSTAGAKVALERYGSTLGKMLAFCIAGHHTGLANGVNGDNITALKD